MKRDWILSLATAAGMSLLTAMPGFGGDTTPTNIKKPTDVKKPAVQTAKPATTSQKLSVKSDKPVVQNKKTVQKKEQSTSKMTSLKVNSKPVASVKTPTITKPPFVAMSKVTIGSPAKSTSVPSAKPAMIVKSTTTPKVIPATKPAPVAKKVDAKPVAVAKPVVNAKSAPAIAKPAQKLNVKPVSNSKLVSISKPAVPVKLAVNTKMVEKTKPVVNAKPVVNSKTIVAAKPVVNTKPIITTKPAVTTKPVINTKPAVKENKPQPQAAKPTPVSKPAIAATTKKMESKPVLKKESASWKLPAEYERLNLSNEQREKVYAITSRYDGEISKLEGMLNSLKSDRQRELSALMSVKPTPSLTKAKTPEVKPTQKIGPTKPAMSNGKVKTQSTKIMNSKPVATLASAAPISKDKSPSKAPVKK
jgi:hypothetical protein